MGDPSDSGSDSAIIGFTGKMLMVGVILFFFVAAFVLFLQLYAKWFWYSQEEEEQQQNAGNRTVTRRRRRLDFSPGHNESSSSAVFPRQKPSLDPSILKSLPVVAYDSKDFKDGLECSVCLSDLVDGEKLRLLPKCNHGFHLECIDMWFQSHSSCPLCRSSVSSSTNIVTSESTSLETILGLPIGEIPDDGPNFPTNVLFCGDETRIISLGLSMEDNTTYSNSLPPSSSSSSSSAAAAVGGMVVVDIPARQGNEDEGSKSPLTTRLRSLKRLLSRDNKERSSGSVEAQT